MNLEESAWFTQANLISGWAEYLETPVGDIEDMRLLREAQAMRDKIQSRSKTAV